MPNISRSENNQTMKLGQVIEHNKRNIFFKNHFENETGRLVWDFFLFFKEALYKANQVVCSLGSIYDDSPQFDIQ